MIKSIKINEHQSLELNGSWGWAFVYKSQFGKDVLPDLLPVFEAFTGIIADLFESLDGKEINVKNISENIDDDMIENMYIYLSGFETTTILQIVWALAKNAKPDIKPIEEWINEFDPLPIDDILPAAINVILSSSVSSKNLKRLTAILKTKAKSASKESLSPASTEA